MHCNIHLSLAAYSSSITARSFRNAPNLSRCSIPFCVCKPTPSIWSWNPPHSITCNKHISTILTTYTVHAPLLYLLQDKTNRSQHVLSNRTCNFLLAQGTINQFAAIDQTDNGIQKSHKCDRRAYRLRSLQKLIQIDGGHKVVRFSAAKCVGQRK